MTESAASSVDEMMIVGKNIHIDKDNLIGRGGYGAVYKASHERYGTVAVKMIIDSGLIPNRYLFTTTFKILIRKTF